jgi:membrane-associated protein
MQPGHPVASILVSPLAAVGTLDPGHLLTTFGTIGLFLIVFAESGLLIGFFLPGDSLLFTAGLFAARGDLNYPVVMIGCTVAAILGDQVGYVFGQRVGPSLFRRPDSRLFKQSHVERAHEFFERHGAKTIVLARFVPIVRTFAPIVAGVGGMPYRTFVTFNVLGGVLWGAGVTTLGHQLGKRFPALADNLIYVSAVIVLVSLIPIMIEVRRSRGRARARQGS